MTRRRAAALGASAVCAVLVLAGGSASAAAPGSNRATFTDPATDNGGAPDIRATVVSNDNAGVLTFRIGLVNRPSGPAGSDSFRIRLRPTGVQTVWELVRIYATGDCALLRDQQQVPAPSLTCSAAADAQIFKLNRSDLGSPGSFDFFIAARGASGLDIAPNSGTWHYDIILGGTPPPPPSSPTGTATGTVTLNGKPFTSGPIPFGSVVDVTHGTLTLVTDVGTVTLYGDKQHLARFVLRRASERLKGKLRRLVEFRLVGGSFRDCSARATALGEKTKEKKVKRALWGKGKGNFRTRGHHAAATVRGTTWLVSDRCDGTLTFVGAGVVAIRDFTLKKTVLLKAGKSYLARAPR